MTVSKAKTFSNILYTGLTKGATVSCQLVASFIVARNLSPSDYGVVGFAFIIIGFLSRFGDLGLANAVVCRPHIEPRNLWNVFALKVILSTAAFITAFSIAPLTHHFFEHPATTDVIRFLALNFVVSIIGFLPQAVLIREMNYKALVFPGIVGAAVRCLLIIVLIVHGWKYWAIVVADVGANLAAGIVTQAIKWVPIRFHFDWPDAREYLRFGTPLLGTGLLVFLILNLDNFLVGTAMGSTKLGYYALAFTWASFICVLLDDTVNSVLLPTFSAVQNDLVAMRRWYLKTIDLMGFVAVVANTALLANAPAFLVTLLGKGTDKWLPAAFALRILCVYGIARAITVPIGICIMARGRTKILLQANAFAGAVELLLLVLVLRSGRIELVASAVLIAYSVQVIVFLPYLHRDLSISFGDLITQLWPVIPAMIVGCVVASLFPTSFGSTIITLAGRGLITASVVAVTHGALSRFRCFQEARGMIAQNFARMGA